MKYTIKDGQPYGYEESQQSLYEQRIAHEGHIAIPEADVLTILNPPKSLQALANLALSLVNAEYTNRMAALAHGYPLLERESWPVQLQEARDAMAFGADAVTPWLEQCAALRGLTREELATRIVAKDRAYRQLAGFLSGVRQKHADEIAALLAAGEASRESLQNYWYLEGWEQDTMERLS